MSCTRVWSGKPRRTRKDGPKGQPGQGPLELFWVGVVTSWRWKLEFDFGILRGRLIFDVVGGPLLILKLNLGIN
jgi:hypothetical protein